MRYKQLGRTGMFVSELCLGAMTFGQQSGTIWSGVAGLDQKGVDEIVGRAFDAGINFIDTADVYSGGESEKLVGQSIRNLGKQRSDVVIATKVHGATGPGPNDRGSSRGHIMDSVSRSLERLNTDYIDLYQIHGSDDVTPVEETLRALDDLVSRGMVRYIGVSNWQAWRMAKALGVSEARGYARFDTVQAYYSIAGRDLEREVIPFLLEEKLGLMVWSPLAGGLLSGKYGPGAPDTNESKRREAFAFPPVDEPRAWKCIAVMREVAARHDTSVASVALAWILAKPFVMSVLIGAKSIEQLDQNIASTRVTLDAEDMARLDEVSTLPSEYPGWMLEFAGVGRIPEPFKPAD